MLLVVGHVVNPRRRDIFTPHTARQMVSDFVPEGRRNGHQMLGAVDANQGTLRQLAIVNVEPTKFLPPLVPRIH
jgi:hypothetical protein